MSCQSLVNWRVKILHDITTVAFESACISVIDTVIMLNDCIRSFIIPLAAIVCVLLVVGGDFIFLVHLLLCLLSLDIVSNVTSQEQLLVILHHQL